MNKLTVKDNNGKDYTIDDPSRFKKHLLDFHTSNDKANLSLHEENGYYFTVTTKLLNEVITFIEKNKK